MGAYSIESFDPLDRDEHNGYTNVATWMVSNYVQNDYPMYAVAAECRSAQELGKRIYDFVYGASMARDGQGQELRDELDVAEFTTDADMTEVFAAVCQVS